MDPAELFNRILNAVPNPEEVVNLEDVNVVFNLSIVKGKVGKGKCQSCREMGIRKRNAQLYDATVVLHDTQLFHKSTCVLTVGVPVPVAELMGVCEECVGLWAEVQADKFRPFTRP